jgi:predicted TIM-barrel fold metal-dependent hydrolase
MRLGAPVRIIDTHHHLWNLSENRYPWLTDHIVAKPYGDYGAIRQNYLIEDFFADIGALPVVKSVHVQAGHDPSDPVRETRWLQAIADDVKRSKGFPHGIVADADLSSPDAEAVLEAHRAYRNLRGIRTILSDSVRYPGRHPDMLESPSWRANLALLRRHDLSLDLQLYPQQMAPVAALARSHPSALFIICHTGLPEDQSTEGRTRWRKALRLLAAEPNVAIKISGFGLFDRDWTVESIRPFVMETIEIFGVERCMFGSDFPVDKLFTSYNKVWASFDEITADFTDHDRSLMFHDNAVRLYRL